MKRSKYFIEGIRVWKTSVWGKSGMGKVDMAKVGYVKKGMGIVAMGNVCLRNVEVPSKKCVTYDKFFKTTSNISYGHATILNLCNFA